MLSQREFDDSVSHSFHDSGNGDLTIDEAKTHFTAWALLKSPLVIVSDEHGDIILISYLRVPTYVVQWSRS